MEPINFMEVFNSYKFKLLRKYNNKSYGSRNDLTPDTCYVFTPYTEHGLLELCEYNLEVLYWFLDKYWEDILYPVHIEYVNQLQNVGIPEDFTNKVAIIKHNLSTSLGKKTQYISEYDPSLLVPIPRTIARDNIGYEHVPFRGIDIWNAWEVSYLDRHGKPHSEVIRFGYDADSVNILESKSLKLYFNSFNQTQIDGDLCEIVKNDIKTYAVANKVVVNIVKDEPSGFPIKHKCIDDLVLDNYSYEYNPDALTIKPTEKRVPIYLASNLLKSNCRHSGLPDWGTAYISYMPSNVELDETSLLDYIISYRNHQEFHEECCERIMFDLLSILNPIWLRVELRYTRRGGLDINPIRVYSRSNEYDYSHEKEYSTFRREFRQ